MKEVYIVRFSEGLGVHGIHGVFSTRRKANNDVQRTVKFINEDVDNIKSKYQVSEEDFYVVQWPVDRKYC